MIQSFRCKRTEALYKGTCDRQFRAFRRIAERKLAMLAAATALRDLRSPPGNGLEQLTRERAGQHSIRINDQWRICFVWTEQGPTLVEITDYH